MTDLAKLTKAAEQGHAGAQYRLGLIYLMGQPGVPRDPDQAEGWLLRAAEQGDYQAQDLLDEMYEENPGFYLLCEENGSCLLWERDA